MENIQADQLDVVVIGNAGIDTQVYLPGYEIDYSVEANFTENHDNVGQAGGYCSRGFARLGHSTAYIGALGDDFLGDEIRKKLEDDGIDLSGVFHDPAGTARSINLMYPDGRRKNFYDGKSHMVLEPDLECCRSILARARLAHFNIPNWARLLLPIAQEEGVTISCDLQDVVRLDDPYRQQFIDYANILFFSAVNFPDLEPVMRALMAGKKGRVVIAGRGGLGCALGYGDTITYHPPVNLKKPVVDTNGAGDGLAVGFLSAYVLRGYPLSSAVMCGQIAARHTCTLRSTSSELITWEQLQRVAAELGSPLV